MTNIIYEKQTNNWEQKQAYKKQKRVKERTRDFNPTKAKILATRTKDLIGKYGIEQRYIRSEHNDYCVN